MVCAAPLAPPLARLQVNSGAYQIKRLWGRLILWKYLVNHKIMYFSDLMEKYAFFFYTLFVAQFKWPYTKQISDWNIDKNWTLGWKSNSRKYPWAEFCFDGRKVFCHTEINRYDIIWCVWYFSWNWKSIES